MNKTLIATPTGYADEVGCTIRPMNGPPMPETGWLGIYFCFWAMGVGFRRTDGFTSSGGGHFGALWAGSGSTGWHSVVNCGQYDDVRGTEPPGYPNCTVRSSKPSAPFSTDEFSANFYWNYGDVLSFRMFRSPKQNWTAAELFNGSLQPPEYTNVDQVTSGYLGAETAFRCMIKKNNDPWLFYNDVLMKDVYSGPAMRVDIFWTEYARNYDSGNPPYFIEGEWPYNPEGRFRDAIWDGRTTMGPGFTCHYDDAGGTFGTDVDLVTDTTGTWIRQRAGFGRSNPEGTVLTPADDFWNPSPTIVSPTPGLDPSPRVATPRPWY